MLFRVSPSGQLGDLFRGIYVCGCWDLAMVVSPLFFRRSLAARAFHGG